MHQHILRLSHLHRTLDGGTTASDRSGEENSPLLHKGFDLLVSNPEQITTFRRGLILWQSLGIPALPRQRQRIARGKQ